MKAWVSISNASYLAVEAAMKDVTEGKTLEVPAHLKNPLKGSPFQERGKGYQYAHDFEGHFVEQEYLAEKRTYYKPSEQGREKDFKAYLDSLKRGLP